MSPRGAAALALAALLSGSPTAAAATRTWRLAARLPQPADGLVRTCVASGDRVVLANPGPGGGALGMLVRAGGTWAEGPAPARPPGVPSDAADLGGALGLEGTTLAIGYHDTVHVYALEAGTFVPVAAATKVGASFASVSVASGDVLAADVGASPAIEVYRATSGALVHGETLAAAPLLHARGDRLVLATGTTLSYGVRGPAAWSLTSTVPLPGPGTSAIVSPTNITVNGELLAIAYGIAPQAANGFLVGGGYAVLRDTGAGLALDARAVFAHDTVDVLRGVPPGQLLVAHGDAYVKDGHVLAFARTGETLGSVAVSPTPASDFTFFGRGGCGDDDYFVTSNVEAHALEIFELRSDEGVACVADHECHGGACVDGVCCVTRCGEGQADCMACSTAAGGQQDGQCTPLVAERAAATSCGPTPEPGELARTCSPALTSCPAITRPAGTASADAGAGLDTVAPRPTGGSSCASAGGPGGAARAGAIAGLAAAVGLGLRRRRRGG